MTLSHSDLLCPALVTKTTVPLLTNAPSQEQATNGQTVIFTACSEYKKCIQPAGHFHAMRNLYFVHDGEQQPLVFTISTDSRFYCIHHISGDCWKTYDITPDTPDATVAAFHVVQHSETRVAAAVSVKTASSSGNDHNLYYAGPFNPKAMDFNPESIAFRKINNNKGPVSISTMTLALNESMSSCFILVGSETDTGGATDYVITPGSDEGNWRTVLVPADSTKILKVLAVTLSEPYNCCAATLYKQNSSSSDPTFDDPDVGSSLFFSSIYDDQEFAINLNKIGGARDVAMTVTPSNVSDLYVAGSKGIAYYASQKVNEDPTVILGDISFKQVVASEKKKIGSNESRISVFAVSTAGEMYFIEGTRNETCAKITFKTMAVPIRRDIGFLSAQYNPDIDASEAVYACTNGSQVKHLLRDPTSTMWTERTVHAQYNAKGSTYDAFETRVNLKGSLGAIVGAGYPVTISSSELAYVLVNNKSYMISQKPTPVMTDSFGCVCVVIQADLSISSPTMQFTVQGLGQSQTIDVDPRQRVTSRWSKYASGTDLKDAKSTTGNLIFADTSIPDSTFDDVVQMLQKISQILTAPGSDVISRQDMDMFQIGGFSIEDLISGAVDAVGETIGDVIEAVSETVENVKDSVVKAGIEIVNGVVRFVATIAGKTFRWVLDAAGTIIRTVIAFLKSTLGLDSTRFFDLFGFAWDHENIIKTQKIIAESATKGAVFLRDVVNNNVASFKDCIKVFRSNMTSCLEDRRISEADETVDWKDIFSTLESLFPKSKSLKSFMDNPIVNEATASSSTLIAKAFSILDNDITLPGADAITKLLEKLTKTVNNLLDGEADNLVLFFNDLIAKVKDLLAGKRKMQEFFSFILSDAFWTVFDAVEDVIDAFLDILPDLIGVCFDMCEGVIEIPGLSPFWEALTDTKLSVLNVLSMALARIMYLMTMIWKDKLPFDLMPPWYTLLPNADSIALFNPEDERTRKSPLNIISSKAGDSTQSDVGSYVDIGFTVLSSMSVMISTALGIGTQFGLPPSTASGHEMGLQSSYRGPSDPEKSSIIRVDSEEISLIDDFTPPTEQSPSKIPIIKIVEWMRSCFNGISFISEIVLWINGWSASEYNKHFKGISVVLKFTDLTLACRKLGGKLDSQILSTITDYTPLLSPIGNNLNALCGAVDFVYSNKNGSDGAALAVSICGFLGAVCDGITVVTTAAKQPEIEIQSVLASLLVNLSGCVCGSVFVVCLKDTERGPAGTETAETSSS